MRSASSFSASRSGRPKFCWSNAFLNSGPTGSCSSSATMPMAVWNAWPARTARDSRSSASGNCSSNRFSRFVRRFMTKRIGSIGADEGRHRRGDTAG